MSRTQQERQINTFCLEFENVGQSFVVTHKLQIDTSWLEFVNDRQTLL
jgi:hypothetical protein